MRQLEEYLGCLEEGSRPSKRSRVPFAGMSPGCVQVPARLVAPPELGHLEDDVAFDVYALPRPTTRLGICVLSLQALALIAYVISEIFELNGENGAP